MGGGPGAAPLLGLRVCKQLRAGMPARKDLGKRQRRDFEMNLLSMERESSSLGSCSCSPFLLFSARDSYTQSSLFLPTMAARSEICTADSASPGWLCDVTDGDLTASASHRDPDLPETAADVGGAKRRMWRPRVLSGPEHPLLEQSESHWSSDLAFSVPLHSPEIPVL